MPFTVKMPKLSPTMTEGTVAKWHKKEGDFVEAGELLLEISTDKATIELNALDEGWLKKILVAENKSAQLNQPIAVFTENEKENIENYVPEGLKPATETSKEEISPSKRKEEKPFSTSLPSQKGLSEPAFIPQPPLEHYSFEYPVEPQEGKIPASPLAKRLAKEKKLDLSTVKGSGPGGRITSEDLQKAQPAGLVTFGHRDKPSILPGAYEELALSPIRKVVAKRLQEAKTFIPHFYVKQVIDAEGLVLLREQLKSQQLKVTFNDFIIRACALALRKHPEVNSGFHSVNQTIIRFKTIDLSIAVAIEEGLITPILRYADYKNLGEISTEVALLAEKARKGKLTPPEYQGGSFCISNLGMYGISEFSAILNPPQAAILAIGGIEEKPVIKNGQVVPGKTLSLTLSVDHRVIDGAQAAQFLKTLQQLLENPAILIV